MNLRNSNEFSSLEDYDKWKMLARWGNGLANATSIYIENSCHNIEHMSFRGMENIVNLTLRNLPNLKTLLLGSNCSGCRWNNAPNYDADRYDFLHPQFIGLVTSYTINTDLVMSLRCYKVKDILNIYKG